MIDCLVFDLDGTLVDSAAQCRAIVNSMLADRGSDRRISLDEIYPYISLGGAPMMAALLGSDGGDPEAEIAEFRRRYVELPTDPASAYAGVADGLPKLVAAGYRLAICSNKPQHLCDKVLGELGLAQHFDVIVGSRPELRKKPHPDLLDLAIAGLGAQPRQCLAVGDSRVDMLTAAGRGLPLHFVTYGYAEGEVDIGDDRRHDRFDGLVAALLRDAPSRRDLAAARRVA